MKVSISQASSGSVHSADEHVEAAREYEYVMQLARAYDRGLINFEKWTEYSSGLMKFLEKHPKAATKFQLVRNLHSRFVQAQRGAHVE
ncbi:peptide methionine sulfoxide reductase msrB [Purpureocillium lavendulum]|uniref:Peptide methionine sulfoxide reductase msrB n=1 Tax=Purpureocillium lavendulum TaxID=1247861 RepID=A0AB34FEL5_9HYPO|nr:peptide methionine sulfoxide reductase msrB [Purpureocillium lavendulum]